MPEDKEKAVEKKEESKPSARTAGSDELSDSDVDKAVGGGNQTQAIQSLTRG